MVTVKKFSAAWCGPCRMLAPMFEQVKGAYSNVTFEDIDIDENFEQVEKYNVTSVPTVVIVKNGEIFERFVGVQSQLAYKNAINESLK
jgi:thioredoxin 1